MLVAEASRLLYFEKGRIDRVRSYIITCHVQFTVLDNDEPFELELEVQRRWFVLCWGIEMQKMSGKGSYHLYIYMGRKAGSLIDRLDAS